MTTLIITASMVITVIFFSITILEVINYNKKRNEEFEDKMKGIFNKELNEYFQKMNIERIIQGYDEALNERLNNQK